MPQIDHVFVLMLENRSFDHFFGLSGLVPKPNDPDFKAGAVDRGTYAPPHEFADVQRQVGPTGAMTGFPPEAKLAFKPSQVPVITQLAMQYLLFDNWFSPMPGPTWPNRFFVHAGSSGGLADSPQDSITPVLGFHPFSFEHGTVYDQIEAVGKKWCVVHGDNQPQVCAIKGMARKLLLNQGFRPLRADPQAIDQTDFFSDLKKPTMPSYVFIEPDYGIQADNLFGHGESQHPLGTVSAGERLIKSVYEAIRASKFWSSSVLLITWDEHGGFYDSAPQQRAAAPGDAPLNADRNTPVSKGYDFTTLGVRVPALLISPFAPKGKLGSQVFPGAAFDHTSVISSLRSTFGLPGPLTRRDQLAPSWTTGLLAKPRADADCPMTLPDAVTDKGQPMQAKADFGQPAPTDSFVSGMAQISIGLDQEMAAQARTPPIATSGLVEQLTTPHGSDTASKAGADMTLQMSTYIHQVKAKLVQWRRSQVASKP